MLPWSAKAEELVRSQYAAVGAAAGHVLPAAVGALEQAAAAGLDVAELLDRTRSRAANAEAFRTAYRRYCWPTSGLSGIRFAPFQLLASEGNRQAGRSHKWHLDLADRLVRADPELIAPTGRVWVDLGDPATVTAAIDWWDNAYGVGRRGHGGQAGRQHGSAASAAWSSLASRCAGASTCASSTALTTPSREPAAAAQARSWP